MTYSSGGLIQAADYNGFVSTNVGANLNAVLNTAYGQTAIATVSTGGTVTATQWASLVNSTASMGAHTNTAITARSAPTTGATINVLAAVNTDLTNIFTNRYNAVSVGTQYTAWTGTNSKTAATSGAAWTITFTNTVTFASSAAASYFFNAGGIVKIDVSKTSTGATGDPEWNDLANTLCGDIYISGLATSHTIAGVAYTGTTKIGGTGTPNTLSTGTGWDALVAGAAATIVYKQFADTAPYTANFIQHSIAKNAGSTVLTITTLWSANDSGPGNPDPITGGTAASGATPGTAPCTIVTYFPPETTNLTNTWGTPTVAATTA
jgi:hypothetical protein